MGISYPPGKRWAMITSGNTHMCGITDVGVTHCWGDWVFGDRLLANPSQVSQGGLLHVTLLASISLYFASIRPPLDLHLTSI